MTPLSLSPTPPLDLGRDWPWLCLLLLGLFYVVITGLQEE